MDTVKPATIMLIGGGALLFIASILDWTEFSSKTDVFGIQWIFTLIIGGGVAVLVVLSNFANVDLPDNVLGLSMNQIYLMLSFAAFLMMFGLQFGEFREIGVLLGWVAAAVMTAGAVMEEQGSGSSAPPTQF